MTWTGAAGAARADGFVLRSGELVEGAIVQATRNTLIIRRAIGGMHQMSIQNIEEVRIDLAQGERISGQMLSWADGTYQIRSGDEVVRISKGRILSRAPYQAEPSRTAPPRPREVPVETAAPAAPAAPAAAAAQGGDTKGAVHRSAARMPAAEIAAAPKASESQSAPVEASKPSAAGQGTGAKGVADDGAAAILADQVAAVREASDSKTTSDGKTGALKASVEPAERSMAGQTDSKAVALKASVEPAEPGMAGQRTGATGVAVVRGVAEMPAVEVAAAPEPDSDRQPVALEASVDPAEPGAPGMVFSIELSRPADQTIVLIYGTVDGTARAGTDYEPQQGVITLAPGTKSTHVRVPLIDHQLPRDETRFELFLTADPKVVNVIDQRITATIPGDH